MKIIKTISLFMLLSGAIVACDGGSSEKVTKANFMTGQDHMSGQTLTDEDFGTYSSIENGSFNVLTIHKEAFYTDSHGLKRSYYPISELTLKCEGLNLKVDLNYVHSIEEVFGKVTTIASSGSLYDSEAGTMIHYDGDINRWLVDFESGAITLSQTAATNTNQTIYNKTDFEKTVEEMSNFIKCGDNSFAPLGVTQGNLSNCSEENSEVKCPKLYQGLRTWYGL